MTNLAVISGCRDNPPASVRASTPSSASAPAAVHRPNVLLVTIDTCRADRIGCYGFPLARTHALDQAAQEGVRCTDAIASAPITMPAHSTLLTGLYPPAHGVRDNGAYALSDDVVTLPERLKPHGYATQAFVSALVLARCYNLTQGFDGYDDDLWAEDSPPLFMIRGRPAGKTAQRAVEWLSGWHTRQPESPFFLWVHFFDPHQPYKSHHPQRHLMPTPYDAEIATADDGIASIMDTLRTFGVLDDTLVILTADHGESLDEHGEKTHAIFVYDATIRVHLILRYPRLLPAGRVYDGPVRTVDLVPTVLDVLGLPGGEQTQGVSLLPAFQGKAPPPELPQYSESLLSEVGFGMAPLYAIRLGGYKWIRAPKPELYDLRSDPHELYNLYSMPAVKPTCERLDRALTGILEQSRRRSKAPKANPLDRERLEMLQALGYLGSDSDRSSMGGMDPKDGIALYNKVEEARHKCQRGQWAAAEQSLRKIMQEAPRHVSAQNILALAVLRQGRQKDAASEYEKSLSLDPRQHRVLYMLGYLNLREGRLDEAERRYRQSLQIVPHFVESMVHLGYIALQRGKDQEAEEWYRKAIAEDPGFPRAYQQYADLYFLRKKYEDALRYYQKVLDALPHHFDAVLQAGLCEQHLGRPKGAREYYERAGRLRPDSWIPPYNLACLRAVDGDSSAALSLLGEAVKNGMNDPNLLETDEDLKSIRALEGYDEILAQVLAAAGAASSAPARQSGS